MMEDGVKEASLGMAAAVGGPVFVVPAVVVLAQRIEVVWVVEVVGAGR